MSCLKDVTIVLVALVVAGGSLHAGTTGKIAGQVTDGESRQPLPGVNVVLEGTTLGAATDAEGDYLILNVPPGVYVLKATMIGYKGVRVQGVRVSADHTARIDIPMTPTVLELEETVTVTAERPVIRKDLTSTLAAVGAEEISQLPVETLADVLELQTGVVRGAGGELHIRGGRASEIAYLIDGVSVTDPFSGNAAVQVENAGVQELQVVSGTFNAEYGLAMSGVVDIATKEGTDRVMGEITGYAGDYLSGHKETFLHIDRVQPLSIRNGQFSLSGPVPGLGQRLTFFATGRYFYNEGWLYGQRIFNPSDSSNFDDPDPAKWYIEKTGDGAFVPMNPYRRYSAQGKFTYRFSSSAKVSYMGILENVRSQAYEHLFKYNPDGNSRSRQWGYTHLLSWTHVLSPATFYTIKASQVFSQSKSFVYENPFDPRYVNPRRLFRKGAFSFHTGGVSMGHNYRSTTTWIGKADVTSQVTKTHQMKMGLEVRRHRLWLHEFDLVMDQSTGWKLAINPITAPNHNRYVRRPVELSVYVQDKMEFPYMIVNAGLRYDYFNSNGMVPLDLRDPNNSYWQRPLWHREAKAKQQLSPRLGIAYPITDRGVIHFSYGHFFQIPPFEFLYRNPEFEVIGGGLYTTMGNADLEPQKTVIYEIGLQQQLTEDIGIDVTGFYKDIRDLLGTEIHETYILGDRYARYVNRDYGNVRGFTVAIDKRPSHHFWASMDYTYQVAEGNASDPNSVFLDQQSDPPRESEVQVVPLDWDQSHTLNFTFTLGDPTSWSVSLIGRLGSGLPYTPEVQNLRTSFENSERKPAQQTFDLRAYKNFRIGRLNYSLFLKVYNLFDRRNENQVYLDTGRAYYTLVSRYAGDVRGVNTLKDFLNRPDFYSEPRQVVFGVSVSF